MTLNKRRFAPSVGNAALESRLVLSPATVTAALIRRPRFPRLPRPPADTGTPFVVAPAGVPQRSINFTTHRARQILRGIEHGVDLSVLAVQVPYGRERLLPQWQDAATRQEVLDDLVTYMEDNIGDTFNYLQSRDHRANPLAVATNGTV